MTDEPERYDREFTTIINRRAQIRAGFSRDRGDVTQFFVQLEYWLDGDWLELIRFDQKPDTEFGHDITEDGLHMDIYRDGQLGERMVETLAEETGNDPDDFDVDPDHYEFPDPDA